jgi:hypothetical protein
MSAVDRSVQIGYETRFYYGGWVAKLGDGWLSQGDELLTWGMDG